MTVQTAEEAFWELADTFVKQISKQFHGAIRAIYRISGDRSIPEQLATCTLLSVGPDRLLLTAAHVADHCRKSSLYVAGRKHLVPIMGQFVMTRAPDRIRDRDNIDLALCKLNDQTLDALGDVTFIPSELIDSNRYPSSENRLFTCLGYPNSRNKNIHVGNQSIETRLWKYTSNGVALPVLENRYLDDEFNFCIEFHRKKARNAQGRVVNTIWPIGASGGPVFNIGDFANPAIFLPGTRCLPRLVGVVIEKPVKADVLLIARIGVAVRLMHQRFN